MPLRFRPNGFCLTFTLNNFKEVITETKVGLFIKNSSDYFFRDYFAILVVRVYPQVLRLPVQNPSYINTSSYFFLLLLMIPPTAMLIPFYLIVRDMGLLGTRLSVILLDTAFDASFVVWMMRSYFLDVPKEMEEAALVDGANQFTAFVKVALPMSIPGIIASALYTFIFSWNDFIFALMLTTTKTKTIPLGILASFSAVEIGWGRMTAMSIFAIIPAVIISLFLNRYFVQGLTFGATKG